VHISTAYANCHKEFSPECIVKPLHDPQVIIEMVKSKSNDAIEAEAAKLIHPWPNTYTFTKSLAEWILNEEAGELNACIFRPSIIGASAEEPVRVRHLS
jgi:fatty acyl-CoA reductase